MNIKFRERTWFVFVLLFILSYIRKFDLSSIRFIVLGIIQLLAIIDIIKNKINIKYDKNLCFIILCITLCMVISNFNSIDLKESIIKIVSVIDLFAITMIFIPNYYRNVNFYRMLEITAFSLGVVLTFSIIFFRNDFIYTYSTGRIGGETRLYAGFTHPNTLGMFAFICFVSSFVTLFYFNKNINRKEKVFLIYFVISMMYVMVKADCRTALLSTVILIMIVMFNKFFENIKDVKRLVIVFFISIVILILFCNINKITFDGINKLLSYRLTYIQTAMNDLIDNNNLFFGHGAFRNSSFAIVKGVLLDNGYMNTIYQYGIITSFFVFFFLLYLLKKISKEKDINNQIIINIFIVFLIYSLTDNTLLNISNFFSIYIYAIIFIGQNNKKGD